MICWARLGRDAPLVWIVGRSLRLPELFKWFWWRVISVGMMEEGTGLQTGNLSLCSLVFSCLSVFEVGHICIFKINRCLSNTWAGGLKLSVGLNCSPASEQCCKRKQMGKHARHMHTHFLCAEHCAGNKGPLWDVGSQGESLLRIWAKVAFLGFFFQGEGNNFKCHLGEKWQALLCFYFWLMLIIGSCYGET